MNDVQVFWVLGDRYSFLHFGEIDLRSGRLKARWNMGHRRTFIGTKTRPSM